MNLPPTLSDSARLALITRVLDTAYNNTESFEHDQIGSNLAYLCGAIARGTRVDWTDDYSVQSIVWLFKSWFTPDDTVWAFIDIP